MEKEKNDQSKKLWDTLGLLLGMVMMLVYLLFVLNNVFDFIPPGSVWLRIIINLTYYGPLALIVITTFEYASKKSKSLKFIVLAIWAVIILFSISPDFFGLIKG